MKKKMFMGLLSLSGILLITTGCGEDVSPIGSGSGRIVPDVDLDTQVHVSKKASRTTGDITADDLALILTADDGSYSGTWPSVSQFPIDQDFKVGNYTLEASLGSLEDEGFEKPYYYGSQQLRVTENNTTTVSLTAALANSMVSIEYTDAFKKYMTAWNAELHSAGGNYVYYGSDETRPAYLRPGNVTVSLTFTKPEGSSATLQVASFQAVAQHHYHMTIDVNNGGVGDAVLKIVFDDQLDEEAVEIELSDELMNAPAPEISTEGFIAGETITAVAGVKYAGDLKMNLIAKGELASVILTTQSPSLISQGWPAEVDLINASEATQSYMKALGFNATGVWKNPDKMAVLDFSEVTKNIGYSLTGNNQSVFSVVVKDKFSKVCEPVTLNINVEPLVVELSNPSALEIGGSSLDIDLKYNGADPNQDVIIEYYNERATWTPLSVNSVSPVDGEPSTYRVNLTVPADNRTLKLHAKSGSIVSQEITVGRSIPDYTVSIPENDVWATSVTIHIGGNDNAGSLVGNAVVYISTDGSGYAAAANTAIDNDAATIKVSGLASGTKYFVKVSLTDDPASAKETNEFTTEAAAAVPNGDFEDLTQTLSATMNQSGKWSISAGINYQSTLTYTISEPSGWASVNAKTANPQVSNQNSWFVVPSTFNTTLSWLSTVPSIPIFGGGGTETPESYAGFQAYSGSNAMVVRNVAWDQNGTTPDTWKKEFAGSGEYYNHNVPDISQRSAGKLFLGSYSYSDGTENYNEGAAFTSRPSSLTGYYTYTADGQNPSENGMVTVTLLNGTTVIGTGSAKLSTASDYTQFNVPVNYIDNAPKATSLRIMITSSDSASYNQAEETSSIVTSTHLYRYEAASHGATLVVDNLSFNY